jgi:hypothetical protein
MLKCPRGQHCCRRPSINVNWHESHPQHTSNNVGPHGDKGSSWKHRVVEPPRSMPMPSTFKAPSAYSTSFRNPVPDALYDSYTANTDALQCGCTLSCSRATSA